MPALRPAAAARDVIEFVALDRDNPSSVWNCLRAARGMHTRYAAR